MHISSILHRLLPVFMLALLMTSRVAAQTSVVEHTVKAGETLYGIAVMYNTDVESLKSANAGITENIKVGQKLAIPTTTGTKKFHTIAAKETLFSISRRYNIEIAKIIEANPGLNEQNFRAGATIVIPLQYAVTSTVAVTESALEGIAGSQCREMYKVKKKDTFFSVAKKFDLLVEELAAANPDIPAPDYSIHKGDYLCIPFAADKSEIIGNRQAFAKYATSSPKSRLCISLIMPFYGNDEQAKKCVVFYRGLLAATDSLRREGISFEISAFDAGGSLTDFNTLLQSGKLGTPDLIISYANDARTKTLSNHCKEKNIRLFLPFSGDFDGVFTNSQTILAYQPESYAQVATVKHFMNKYGRDNIIYVQCPTNDNPKNYAAMLLTSLEAGGSKFKKVNLNDGEAELFAAFEPSKKNVIVLSSYSKQSFNVLAEKLDKLAASLVSVDYSMFGHREWADFEQALRNKFFKYDVNILTPQYINVYSPRYGAFLSAYKSTFEAKPSTNDQRAYFLGVDLCLYLLQSLSSQGIVPTTQSISAVSIERPISFARINNWGGLINKALRSVHFTKFHTTEITDYAQ